LSTERPAEGSVGPLEGPTTVTAEESDAKSEAECRLLLIYLFTYYYYYYYYYSMFINIINTKNK